MKKLLPPDIYFKRVPKSLNMDMRSELYYINEFTFAVAVILSAQATDKKVNEITPNLFKLAGTPEKMLAMGIDRLRQHISVISFFNNKGKNILAASKILIGYDKTGVDADWVFPENFRNQKSLMSLPGVGQKTANVIMNVLWDVPVVGVDTHVYRLAHRFGWALQSDNTPEKVEAKLMEIIPKKFHAIVNHTMVLHGRYICTARRPKCAECAVRDVCNAPDKIG